VASLLLVAFHSPSSMVSVKNSAKNSNQSAAWFKSLSYLIVTIVLFSIHLTQLTPPSPSLLYYFLSFLAGSSSILTLLSLYEYYFIDNTASNKKELNELFISPARTRLNPSSYVYSAHLSPGSLSIPQTNNFRVSPYRGSGLLMNKINSSSELEKFINNNEHQDANINLSQNLTNSPNQFHDFGANPSVYTVNNPYLRLQQRTALSRHDNSNSQISSSSSSSLPVNTPLYAHSLRNDLSSEEALLTPSRYSVADERSDIELSESANMLFNQLNVSNHIDKWARNMRKYVCSVILQPLITALHRNSRDFRLAAQWVLETQQLSISEQEKNLLRDSKNRADDLANYISAKYPTRAEVIQRKSLHKYLLVGKLINADNPNTRNYVKNRIAQLVQGSELLLNYHWNSNVSTTNSNSSTQQSSQWNSNLPTDAHIIIHCWNCYFEDLVPDYTKLHYRDAAVINNPANQNNITMKALSESYKKLTIVQTRPVNNPYFLLRLDVPVLSSPAASNQVKTKEFKPEPGKNNIFQCLVLFVYLINRYAEGRIGQLRLTDKSCEQLANILQ
jgi:hypothetical protein